VKDFCGMAVATTLKDEPTVTHLNLKEQTLTFEQLSQLESHGSIPGQSKRP
jgi:hypothetical protein